LVIDTRSTNPRYSNHPIQTKFIGGTEEFHEHEDRNILDTLRRELTEETDMVLRDDLSPSLILSKSLPGHFKNFYDIDWRMLTGELRTVEKTIEGDWMSAPYWLGYEDSCRRLYETHQPALQKSQNLFQAKIKAA
jgi:hypothetical protein